MICLEASALVKLIRVEAESGDLGVRALLLVRRNHPRACRDGLGAVVLAAVEGNHAIIPNPLSEFGSVTRTPAASPRP